MRLICLSCLFTLVYSSLCLAATPLLHTCNHRWVATSFAMAQLPEQSPPLLEEIEVMQSEQSATSSSCPANIEIDYGKLAKDYVEYGVTRLGNLNGEVAGFDNPFYHWEFEEGEPMSAHHFLIDNDFYQDRYAEIEATVRKYDFAYTGLTLLDGYRANLDNMFKHQKPFLPHDLHKVPQARFCAYSAPIQYPFMSAIVRCFLTEENDDVEED